VTVLTDPAVEEADGAHARYAFLVVLGETWLTTFGTDPHGGAIDHALMRHGVRVTRSGSVGRVSSVAGRGVSTGQGDDVSGEDSAMCLRASAIARIDEMISRSDIVHLSDGDLARLRPGDRDGDAIRWLMSRGPAILVVTHGHAAATGYARSGSVHLRARSDVVADADVWEEDFAAKLVQALTVRDLLARGTDRTLRTVGLGELREILHEAIIR
jgi:hypothetical protein